MVIKLSMYIMFITKLQVTSEDITCHLLVSYFNMSRKLRNLTALGTGKKHLLFCPGPANVFNVFFFY